MAEITTSKARLLDADAGHLTLTPAPRAIASSAKLSVFKAASSHPLAC
ncbi:hypothetical protein [uncultured Brevundimonas sp.]|nr:hypothetical protein [uncultured Brevundimonas sp.]